nr:hypothetical protein GCM10025699_21430 [Microbacterium flavescens]
MGGHVGGEIASASTIDRLKVVAGAGDVTPKAIEKALSRAVKDIASHPEATDDGTGTTLTGLYLDTSGETAHWVTLNIGDSRVYLVRDGAIVQITTDHSVVQELIASGRLSPEEAENHPYGNVITRAVGPSEGVIPDYVRLDVAEGDRFVICSDGLTKELTDYGIRHFLDENPDPADAAMAMLDAALENGGRDNITIIVLDVGSAPGPGPTTRRVRPAIAPAAIPPQATTDAHRPPAYRRAPLPDASRSVLRCALRHHPPRRDSSGAGHRPAPGRPPASRAAHPAVGMATAVATADSDRGRDRPGRRSDRPVDGDGIGALAVARRARSADRGGHDGRCGPQRSQGPTASPGRCRPRTRRGRSGRDPAPRRRAPAGVGEASGCRVLPRTRRRGLAPFSGSRRRRRDRRGEIPSAVRVAGGEGDPTAASSGRDRRSCRTRP